MSSESSSDSASPPLKKGKGKAKVQVQPYIPVKPPHFDATRLFTAEENKAFATNHAYSKDNNAMNLPQKMIFGKAWNKLPMIVLDRSIADEHAFQAGLDKKAASAVDRTSWFDLPRNAVEKWETPPLLFANKVADVNWSTMWEKIKEYSRSEISRNDAWAFVDRYFRPKFVQIWRDFGAKFEFNRTHHWKVINQCATPQDSAFLAHKQHLVNDAHAIFEEFVRSLLQNRWAYRFCEIWYLFGSMHLEPPLRFDMLAKSLVIDRLAAQNEGHQRKALLTNGYKVSKGKDSGGRPTFSAKFPGDPFRSFDGPSIVEELPELISHDLEDGHPYNVQSNHIRMFQYAHKDPYSEKQQKYGVAFDSESYNHMAINEQAKMKGANWYYHDGFRYQKAFGTTAELPSHILDHVTNVTAPAHNNMTRAGKDNYTAKDFKDYADTAHEAQTQESAWARVGENFNESAAENAFFNERIRRTVLELVKSHPRNWPSNSATPVLKKFYAVPAAPPDAALIPSPPTQTPIHAPQPQRIVPHVLAQTTPVATPGAFHQIKEVNAKLEQAPPAPTGLPNFPAPQVHHVPAVAARAVADNSRPTSPVKEHSSAHTTSANAGPAHAISGANSPTWSEIERLLGGDFGLHTPDFLKSAPGSPLPARQMSPLAINPNLLHVGRSPQAHPPSGSGPSSPAISDYQLSDYHGSSGRETPLFLRSAPGTPPPQEQAHNTPEHQRKA